MAAALELDGLARREPGAERPLVAGVSARIAAGSITALAGADGAGKTTCMRMMAGILPPSEGRVLLFGEDLYGGAAGRADVGYMPQRFGLYEDLTVAQNMQLYADLFGLAGAEREQRFAELLAMTDLARFTGRPAGALSGGMKQKLGLACALLNRPRVLLLDEPSVGVDPLSRKELWAILRRGAEGRDMTVVIATTYMDEAALCDAVLVIEEGRLALSGRPAELAALARGAVWLALPAPGQHARLLQAALMDDAARVIDAVPEAGGVRLVLKPGITPPDVPALRGLACRPAEPRLEDGYLAARAARAASGGAEPASSGPSAAALPPAAGAAGGVPIAAREIVRRFGDFTAVDRVSFEVRPGEIFGLLGPNGAGKTTTFKMLCGLLQATSGELFVAGVDVREDRGRAKAQVGYMSQRFGLYGDLSARQNMDFFAGAYGLGRAQRRGRIAELAREFGLEDALETPAKALPGGVKQRLAMAVALLHRRAILFLDEPTSGL
ncbi:MAG: ABC transporter ATP-binding protein, partial [Duodenibacillus sp.]|nr:ABC transporter ATP-binding protein [Duodenibacillus sp.]